MREERAHSIGYPAVDSKVRIGANRPNCIEEWSGTARYAAAHCRCGITTQRAYRSAVPGNAVPIADSGATPPWQPARYPSPPGRVMNVYHELVGSRDWVEHVMRRRT